MRNDLGGWRWAGLAVAAIVAISAPQSSAAAAEPPAFQGESFAFKPAAAPAPVPDLAFTALDGTPRRLADFRGRTVVINLWATWCAPCVKEMPALDALQAKLGGERFTVLALSIDRSGARIVEPFLAKLALPVLPVYLDPPNASGKAFTVRGIPTTVLIDAEGREVGRMEGAADWASEEAVALIRFYMRPGS